MLNQSTQASQERPSLLLHGLFKGQCTRRLRGGRTPRPPAPSTQHISVPGRPGARVHGLITCRIFQLQQHHQRKFHILDQLTVVQCNKIKLCGKVTLQSPFEEFENITLDGQWSIHNGFEILKLPFLHVCSENFNTHGIYVHVFGTLYFIIVYAIPGNNL
uniref:Uncharacterized protein n=1 Tax=Trichogramma kaykai TaxID=54128 RepID=A0ABD2WT53_9HYME